MSDVEARQRETRQVRFSSPEQPEELKEYRRLSLFAVLALTLGLLSVAALVHPLLWVFPIAAVGFATLALWQFRQSSELAGKKLAVIGLAVALLFGSCSVSWSWARQITLSQQARAHVEYWFSLLSERRLLQAHQLTKAPYERLTPDQSLEKYYAGASRSLMGSDASGDDHAGHDHANHDHANHDHAEEDREKEQGSRTPEADGNQPMMPQEPTPRDQLAMLYGEEPLKSILAQQGKFQLRFVETVTIGSSEADVTIIDQRYRISYPEDGQLRDRLLEVRMQRRIRNGRAQWNLVHVHELQPRSSSAATKS